ncbi:DNA internalization-related competence protein ComEC/Rec2 [bacterium]|nr:DNA internalization-related competence protein ComEC/Rec2 [bacterium]
MNLDFKRNKLFTVLITVFYIAGLCASFYNHQILFAFLSFIVLGVLIFYSNIGLKKSLILYLIFFLGIARGFQNNEIKEYHSNNAYLEGMIITSGDINLKNNKIKFYIRQKTKFLENEKILVSLDLKNDIQNKVKIGNFVKIKGKLRTPQLSGNPYQFDYKKYLQNNDCRYILYGETYSVYDAVKFGKNLNNDWYYILRQFEGIRNKIIKVHSKNIKSPRLEVLGGIVFGNETINPDENVKESFKNSGLLHLLAASGLNVALIYGIWQWIASLLKLPYNLSILTGCVLIIFYTFMTGFPPSILRASLMILFVLFGKLIDKEADSGALIFFVGFLILLFQPKMIFDIGFQLSFMVTLGLITGVEVIISKFKPYDEKFKEKYKHLSRFQKYIFFLFSPLAIASIIAVPLVAQLWVVPLQMHYFNNFAPLSILANIAVVPFIGVLSFIGFISSIIALVPYFGGFAVFIFDMIANPLLALLIKISTIFSGFKYSLISTVSLNVFQIFNFWGIIFIFILNLKNNFKYKKQLTVLYLLILIFILSFIKLDYFNKNLEIIMFDVGNADSFLIKTPDNKYFMIDTGRKSYQGYSSGDAIINRYLKNERIGHINTLILTHFDLDHIGGVLDVLKNNKIDNVIIQKTNPDTYSALEVIKYLNENKINYKVAQNETIYKIPNFEIKTFVNSLDDDNEASIVTLVCHKNKNILFMADMGLRGFEEIKNNIKSADILKVGHHGAKNTIDNNMLNQLKPGYALISTGVNKFNHPDYSTINLLDYNNIKTISTGSYGFVKIIIDDDIKFYHFDKAAKNIVPVEFLENNTPFHKTKYVKDFIKSNL